MNDFRLTTMKTLAFCLLTSVVVASEPIEIDNLIATSRELSMDLVTNIDSAVFTSDHDVLGNIGGDERVFTRSVVVSNLTYVVQYRYSNNEFGMMPAVVGASVHYDGFVQVFLNGRRIGKEFPNYVVPGAGCFEDDPGTMVAEALAQDNDGITETKEDIAESVFKAVVSDGSITNLIQMLVRSGEFCMVSGHKWNWMGSTFAVVTEHASRSCLVCGVTQTRMPGEWK